MRFRANEHCSTCAFAQTISFSKTTQNTATHCNTLQRTAKLCNTLQQTAARCSGLQHTATRCSKLQDTAVHAQLRKRFYSPKPHNTLQYIAKYTATYFNELQRTATNQHIGANPFLF